MLSLKTIMRYISLARETGDVVSLHYWTDILAEFYSA